MTTQPALSRHIQLTERVIFTLMVAATLGACSAMPATQSGFIQNSAELVHSPDGSSAKFRSLQRIDPHQILAIDIEWATPKAGDYTSEERAQLIGTLHSAIAAQFIALPNVKDGRPIVIRAAITRVEAVSPALNAVSTVLLFAPLDRGGAAVEMEVLDAQTRQPLASLAQGIFIPMSDFKARFTRLAPAELALQQAASELALLVNSKASIPGVP